MITLEKAHELQYIAFWCRPFLQILQVSFFAYGLNFSRFASNLFPPFTFPPEDCEEVQHYIRRSANKVAQVG